MREEGRGKDIGDSERPRECVRQRYRQRETDRQTDRPINHITHLSKRQNSPAGEGTHK